MGDNNREYCNQHKGYIKQETKTITCIDCGEEVEVDAWDMTKVRCDECQSEHRKAWDRERKRKLK